MTEMTKREAVLDVMRQLGGEQTAIAIVDADAARVENAPPGAGPQPPPPPTLPELMRSLDALERVVALAREVGGVDNLLMLAHRLHAMGVGR